MVTLHDSGVISLCYLSDERLQQRGRAFSDTSHSKAEAAAAPLHDAVISLMSVQRL